ncbi:helix-turn-helix domain-containing protein [Actinosynnema sp. NPDC004786]
MGEAGDRRGRTPFAAELERHLVRRGLSWRKFADLAGYTPGWLSKIKNGTPPSPEFARRCDELLEAHGTLLALAGNSRPRPAELPAAIAGFIGRGEHLAALDAMLTKPQLRGASRVAVIEGAPGVGKTALALRWAHDVSPRFPDGQLFVDLRGFSPHRSPTPPEDALEELLLALGSSSADVAGLDLDRRAALLRSLLADRQVLLVLDNAADSEQVRPLLPGSGSCFAVVTSRRALPGLTLRTHGGRLDVGRLTDAESVDLLRDALGEARLAEDQAAPMELVRRCGHLPLALRIAAEHLLTNPLRSVRDLVADLTEESSRLDVLSLDDEVAVRTVFSWSYRRLSADERRALRLVGALPPEEITTAAVAVASAMPYERTQQLLNSLVSAHMLEHLGGDRFRLHELLRLFAVERVAEEDERARVAAALARLDRWSALDRLPTSC